MEHYESSSSSDDGLREYRLRPLNYEELGNDCHYLTLRHEGPIELEKKSKKCKNMKYKKNTLEYLKNHLNTLEKEKKMIEEELLKETQPPELIDLVSDDELILTPQDQFKLPTCSFQRNMQKENSPLDKFFLKRRRASHDIERESSDNTEESYEKYRHRKIQRETDSTRLRERKRSERKGFQDIDEIFGEFQCKVCNIKVYSEGTLHNHLAGRKHLKALRFHAVSEVAHQSLEESSSKPSSCMSFDYDGPRPLHYPPSTPNMTRIRVNKIAKLQRLAEGYRKQPIVGLKHITEIHLPNEIIYYCALCDSNCALETIMPHLIGIKHKLNFCQQEYPKMFERNQYKHRREFEVELQELLLNHDKTHGRGLIKVEEEVKLKLRKRLSENSSYLPQYKKVCNRHCSGNCRSYPEIEIVHCDDLGENIADSLQSEDLDVTMNDYFCKVCDSHMNNEQMWESHIRGRRHIKNKQKRPGEKPSKIRNIFCPQDKPKILDLISEIREAVVGLNYVQEVQGREGDQYKCFLCGACCTTFDIVEHILSEKHRIKLLEAENRNGRKNDIDTILNLARDFTDKCSRMKLVAQEALNFQKKYGKGRPKVYKSKDIYNLY